MNNCHLPPFELKCLNKLSRITCTVDEIKTLIDILNPNKASGPDGISNKMFKPVAKEIAVPLSIIFNRSFREGRFADSWKYSNVIPLPKKGDNSDPSNFRPVSLLSGLGKLQHSVYPSVCRTDGYGTDRRLQEHALFRAKNVLYSFSSKTVRFECIVISALHVFQNTIISGMEAL